MPLLFGRYSAGCPRILFAFEQLIPESGASYRLDAQTRHISTGFHSGLSV